MTTPDEFMTTQQVAVWLQVSEQSLIQDRFRDRGLPYVKLGRRVRYRRQDVIDYLDANLRQPR